MLAAIGGTVAGFALTIDLHIFGTDGAVDRITFQTVRNGVHIVLESHGVRCFERIVDRTTRRFTLQYRSRSRSPDPHRRPAIRNSLLTRPA
jgi:hypothetical protein